MAKQGFDGNSEAIKYFGLKKTPWPLEDEIPFEDAWKQLTQKTENIRLSGICEKCSNRGICHSCAAMAYAETGEFQKVPIYLCEMMDAMKKIAEMELSNLE